VSVQLSVIVEVVVVVVVVAAADAAAIAIGHISIYNYNIIAVAFSIQFNVHLIETYDLLYFMLRLYACLTRKGRASTLPSRANH
jgi:hypothetical protein